jgi:hypothetical protein
MAGMVPPARLDTLAREAAFKLKRSKEYETSGLILVAECKRRIEAGEVEVRGLTWPQYCRVRVPIYPPAYLDRLILRYLAPAAEDESEVTISEDAFDCAWAAFITLSPERQREFLSCGVAYAMDPARDDGAAAPGRPHALDCQV